MFLKVHVYPQMKKERVTKLKEHTYEIVVKEPAERNLANKRVRTLIAREYGITDKDVRIVTGHHSPSKVLELTLN